MRSLADFLISFFILLSPNLTKNNAAELSVVKKFLPENCFQDRKDSIKIQVIMIHFCSDMIQNPQNPYSIDRIFDIFTQYNLSSHYLIDREGVVYQFVEEQKMAKHAGKGINQEDTLMNDRSIGIELFGIGTFEEMQVFNISYSFYTQIPAHHIGFTDLQYQSLNRLMDDIIKRNPGIRKDREHILGHDEYAPHRKTDPGRLFDWGKIGF